MANPGGPRPESFPPGSNPNALANSLQNLGIYQQRSSNLRGSVPRPSNTPPFGQQPPPFTGSRPGPPIAGAIPRGPVPSGAPGQATLPPTMGPSRPTGSQQASQPPPFGSRPPPPGVVPSSLARGPSHQLPGVGPRPAPYSFPPVTSQPLTPPQMGTSISNGTPPFASGMTQGGPQFPPAKPSVGLPQSPTMSPGPSSPSLHMRPGFGSSSTGASSSMGQPAPPFSASAQAPLFSAPPQAPPFSAPPQSMPPPPGSSPFSRPVSGMPQPSTSPFGMHSWPRQQQGVPPSFPGQSPQQPPQLYGMPQGTPPLPNQSTALGQTGQSKIDPNQIPRLTPSSTVILHETRQDNQANPPPPATSEYIVKDTGNCSPRYIRCTINQIPCTVDLLTTSAMQLSLLVQPLALPHPSEEPIQVVDFGEHGPVRCSRCKGYINPFMKFIDQGRRFICNLCGFIDETPRDYHCNLGPDGRRRDADERPELCRGTVEFIATKEYMVGIRSCLDIVG